MATGGGDEGEGRGPPNLAKYKPAHLGLLTADGNASDELERIKQQMRADMEAKMSKLKDDLRAKATIAGAGLLAEGSPEEIEDTGIDEGATSANLTAASPPPETGELQLSAEEADRIQGRLANMEAKRDEMNRMIEEKMKKLQAMKDELERKKAEEVDLKAQVQADAEKFKETAARKKKILDDADKIEQEMLAKKSQVDADSAKYKAAKEKKQQAQADEQRVKEELAQKKAQLEALKKRVG